MFERLECRYLSKKYEISCIVFITLTLSPSTYTQDDKNNRSILRDMIHFREKAQLHFAVRCGQNKSEIIGI